MPWLFFNRSLKKMAPMTKKYLPYELLFHNILVGSKICSKLIFFHSKTENAIAYLRLPMKVLCFDKIGNKQQFH